MQIYHGGKGNGKRRLIGPYGRGTIAAMEIILIWAMEKRGGIGYGGLLPWHYPEDLKRFKRITMGSPVLMGRKTYESLPSGPLPGRRNLVLTRGGLKEPSPDVRPFSSPGEVLDAGTGEKWEKLFVIGGESVYRLFLPRADKLMVTEIGESYSCDRFFPEYSGDEWKLISSETNGVLTYKVYERRMRTR